MSQWFHAQGERQNGPVSEEEIRRLAATGELGPDDLVWCEGMPEWVPLKTLAQFAPAPGAAPVPAPPSANPYQAPSSPVMAQTFSVRAGDVDVGEALSVGWAGFTQNFWIGTVAALLYFVVTLVVGLIPIVSIVAPLLVTYPMLAGLFYMGVVAADGARGGGRSVELDDLWRAFKYNYGQTVLFGLIIFGISLGAVLVLVLPMVFLVPSAEENPAPIIGAFFLVMVPLVWLMLRMLFAYQLLTDRNLGAIESLTGTWNATRGQLLSLFLLGVVAMLIYIGGALLLFVGIFPALFLIACIWGAAYRQVVGS